ncbi:2-hydroxyacid dehydrogenase [Candidatus Gracilibacteria bacterium]|nr:2-hydroxyacid dehydrogenase [Candidatus Gracilibacteria bacterium]
MIASKIVFLEVEPEDSEKVRQKFPTAKIENMVLTEKEVWEKYPDTEILCGFIYSTFSKKLIKNLPNLKQIVTRSVGYDHIDLAAAMARKIKVCNVPDYGAHVIAEHVFALLLSTIRCVSKGDNLVEECQFDFHGMRGIALKGKTLGLIGTGKIGKNVARIASLGFLMDVIAFDKFPDLESARENHFQYVDNLDEIWEKSDIISLHVPLLPDTKHLICKDSITKMKDGVILINTARGGLIETKSLILAARSEKIKYVALDVLEHEKNIRKYRELIELPNVVITPHIAFYADDSMNKMFSEAFASIDRFLNGEKLEHEVFGV